VGNVSIVAEEVQDLERIFREPKGVLVKKT